MQIVLQQVLIFVVNSIPMHIDTKKLKRVDGFGSRVKTDSDSKRRAGGGVGIIVLLGSHPSHSYLVGMFHCHGSLQPWHTNSLLDSGHFLWDAVLEPEGATRSYLTLSVRIFVRH